MRGIDMRWDGIAKLFGIDLQGRTRSKRYPELNGGMDAFIDPRQ